MALALTVTGNTVIGQGGFWTDPLSHPPAQIPTSCHFATTYWAFRDEFGRFPTTDELLGIGNSQLLMSGLIGHATRKNQPLAGNLTLTPGAVLLFVNSHNVAEHSCVAITAHSVGGYNQGSWYSVGGGNHSYSTHTTAQLHWGTLANRNKVRRTVGIAWYQLYELSENIVKAAVRRNVQ